MIPFDAGLRRAEPQEFIDQVLVARSAHAGCRWGRTSASAIAPRATRVLAADRAVRDAGRGARRGSTARSSPRATSARWCRRARSRSRRGFLGAPFQMRGEVVQGDRRGRELGLPDRQHRPRRGACVPRPRRVRRARRRGVRGGQRRRAPDVRDRARACWSRPTCSTATSISTARILRVELPAAAARRAAVRVGRRADRADAPTTSNARASSASAGRPACYAHRPHDPDTASASTSWSRSSATATRTPARPRSRSRC